MTELAALNVRIAGDASGLSAAVNRATGDLSKVTAAAGKASASAAAAGAALGRLGSSASGAGAGIQQFGWQFSQMGQSVAAGTPLLQAFTMQLGDLLPMLGIGGLAGVAVTAAAVMIPLAGAFLSSSEKALSMSEAVDLTADAIAAYSRAVSLAIAPTAELVAKFGEATPQLRQMLADLAEIEKAKVFEGIDTTAASMRELISAMGSGDEANWKTAVMSLLEFTRNSQAARNAVAEWNAQMEILQTSIDPMQRLAAAMNMRDQLVAATGGFNKMNDAQKAVYEGLVDTIAQLKTLEVETDRARLGFDDVADAARAAAAAAASIGTAAAGAIGAVQALGQAMWDAAMARVQAERNLEGMAREFSPGGQAQIKYGGRGAPTSEQTALDKRTDLYGNPVVKTPKTRKGGGGRAKEDPLIDDLEQLRQSLLTQEAAQVESYMRQQETLRSALEQKLLTQKEYNALMEEAQTQHQGAMAQIDAYRYGDGALQFETFMGDMASAFSAGNDKMLKAARVFGALEATINVWRAYTQTLADPTLPFWAKFAAAAKVLAAGFGAVNAIRGGGGGSKSSASAGQSTSASGGGAMQVSLNTFGVGEFLRTADFGAMLDRLNTEAGDRGYKLMWNPS